MKKFFFPFFLTLLLVSCGLTENKSGMPNDHLSISVSLIKECDYKRAVTHL